MRTRPSVVVFFLLSSLTLAQQPQQRRVVRPVNNASVVRLQGTMHPRALAGTDRGAVAATMALERMTLVFSRTREQQAALDQLLAEQQDPNSGNYHKWLTPEEFGNRFGMAQADIDVVSAWLTAQGFKVEEVARARDWIAFSGIAAQVEAAFHAPIHNYVVNGTAHFAASSDIAVPDAFSGVVAGVTGLHDFAPRPLNVKPRPHVTSSITGNHFVVPGDFATIYNLPLPTYTNGQGVCTKPVCYDGTGQTIAVVGQSSLSTDTNSGRNGSPGVNGQQYDIVTFRNLAGLPPVNLTIKPGTNPPGIVSSDVGEANLDLEWAGAAAPNAALIYYLENSNSGGAFQALVDAVDDNKAQVISVSYGACENSNSPNGVDTSTFNLLSQKGQQANAQGQAIVVASGDAGAADCDTKLPATQGLSVDFPSSMPYSTSIGGTAFSGDANTPNANDPTQPTQYWAGSTNDIAASAFSYIPETAWNDSTGQTSGSPAATGGGASTKFTKPAWQVGPGVPADGARDLPDISFNASASHDFTVICSQSSCVNGYRNTDTTYDVIGGTSVGTPQFAGILALINQAKGSAQGNINSMLYSFVQTYPTPGNANTSWVFNDITSGNNIVATQTAPPTPVCPAASQPAGLIGYCAGPGYDQVTGLGSVDATALIDAFLGTPNPDFTILPYSPTITAGIHEGGGSSISVFSREGFAGAVNLTCTLSPELVADTCGFNTSTVSPPGIAQLSVIASVIQPIFGTQNGTTTVQANSGNLTHTLIIPTTVYYPNFTMTPASATMAVPAQGSASDVITLAPTWFFNANVALTCTASGALACAVNPSTAPVLNGAPNSTVTVTVTSTSSSLNPGSVTLQGTYSTLTNTLQIPVNVTQPDFTLTVASPVVSISSGGSITDNLTITPVGGFSSDVALTCSVPGSLGTTTCTINPPTVTGGSGTAVITIKGAVLSRDRGAPLPFRHRGFDEYATLGLAVGVVLTTPRVTRRRTLVVSRKLRRAVLSLLALCLILLMISCGGGNNGGGSTTPPTPLNGNLTITATGGGVSHTTTINVTVQ
jgi:subtilase family serine protease